MEKREYHPYAKHDSEEPEQSETAEIIVVKASAAEEESLDNFFAE